MSETEQLPVTPVHTEVTPDAPIHTEILPWARVKRLGENDWIDEYGYRQSAILKLRQKIGPTSHVWKLGQKSTRDNEQNAGIATYNEELPVTP